MDGVVGSLIEAEAAIVPLLQTLALEVGAVTEAVVEADLEVVVVLRQGIYHPFAAFITL